MPRISSAVWLQRSVSVLTITGLLCSCAPGALTTQAQRIGTDDGTDSCRPQLVALDSTGNFFGAAILQGAAFGAGTGALAGGLIGGLASGDWRGAAFGALAGAVSGGVMGGSTAYWNALQQQRMDQASLYARVSLDLERENAQIDKTQLAFDQLADCRFHQAQAINAAYAAHRIDRIQAETAMAQVRQRSAQDIALAKMINKQLQERGQQFAVATSKIDPSAGAAISAAQHAPSQPAVVRTVAPIKLRPDPGAPDIAKLQPHEQVTVTSGRNGYAMVRTASGQQGYVSTTDLQGTSGRQSIVLAVSTSTAVAADVRTLAGSNATRRDDFAQSVAVTENAQATGFELAS